MENNELQPTRPLSKAEADEAFQEFQALSWEQHSAQLSARNEPCLPYPLPKGAYADSVRRQKANEREIGELHRQREEKEN